MIAIRIRHP